MHEADAPEAGTGAHPACPTCGAANRVSARFCAACGTALAGRACACGSHLAPSSRFCDLCGARADGERRATLPGAGTRSSDTSLLGGRYRLGRMLGEGAVKRVHHGVDEHLGRDVAIAIVKTEELDEEGARRARREVQALVELAGDPSIVTIFDAVETPRAQYIVTEYLPGGDLQTALGRKAGPVDLATVVSVGLDVLGALETAHAAGIVHRDVKPANVWLDAQSRARLGDFGLALYELARITRDGQILGTAEYISPEAAMHGQVGPAADLYSFGALLYRMVCGRPPFTSDLPIHVIHQHVSTPPIPPSRLAPVAGALESLILALLEKQPGDRPASATDARRRLEELADAGVTSKLPVGVRTVSGFVGRESEMRRAQRLVDRAVSGAGALLLVEGQAGIGKTRFMQELSAHARGLGFQVVWSRGHEGPGVPPYWPWQQVLRECAVEAGSDSDGAAAGGATDPGTAAGESAVPEAPRFDVPGGDEDRFRFAEATAAFLRAAGSAQPLLVVLDDLEWADTESLRLLTFLTRELSSARVLLAATYRTEEVGRREALARTLDTLTRVPDTERLPLGGLPPGAVAILVEAASGRVPPAPLLEEIVSRTGGNPHFVQDLARSLPSEAEIWDASRTDSRSWSLALPRSALDWVGSRLDHLSHACNEVLVVAAVAGATFPEDLVGKVAGVSHGRLLDLLEEAQAAGVVVELRDMPGRYRFVDPLVREALYEAVGRAGRIRLHLRLGGEFEARYGQNLEAHLDEVAYHFYEGATGGDVDKALDYCRLAGFRALRTHDCEAAVQHFERALKLCEMSRFDDAQRCDVLVDLAEARAACGDAAGSRSGFQEAADLAAVLGLPRRFARAVLGHAGIWNPDWRVDTSEVVLLERALSALPDTDDPLRARVLARLAQELRHSDEDEARRLMADEAVALARRCGERGAIAYALMGRILSMSPQDPRQLVDTTDECVALAESVDEDALVLHALSARFSARCCLGDLTGAFADADRHHRLSEACSQPLYRGLDLVMEVSVTASRGDFDTAETCCATVGELADRYDIELLRTMWLAQSVSLEVERGLLPRRAEPLRALVEAHPGYAPFRLLAACADAGTGDLRAARTVVARFAADKFGSLPTTRGHMYVHSLLAELVAFTGDADAASLLHEVLEPHAQECVTTGPLGIVRGPVGRWLGILAATARRWEDSFKHFAVASAWESKHDVAPVAATTRWWYGHALRASGATGAGDVQISAAQGTLAGLGMEPPPKPAFGR